MAKAEHIDGKENPRFVVTSLTGERWAAQPLYEESYCGRGDMENRIKEQFGGWTAPIKCVEPWFGIRSSGVVGQPETSQHTERKSA
jgi:hypothetical protein